MSKYPNNHRLKFFREHLNLSQGDFAIALNMQQGSYSDVERGKASVTYDLMSKIISIYRLNPTWFYTGEGEMLIEEKKFEVVSVNNKFGVFTKTLYNIPIVGGAAAGFLNGYIVGYGRNEEAIYLESYSLPAHRSQNERGFCVYGNSMANEYFDKDVVICRRIFDPQHHVFKMGSTYVILCGEGVIIKHLKKLDGHFLAISANPAFPPYEIGFEEILEYWLVEWLLQRKDELEDRKEDKEDDYDRGNLRLGM